MKQKRSGVKAAVLDNKLYVVGGWDGQNRMRSGEFYNPAKRQWEDLPEMIVPRSNYSLTVVDGQLLVAGGFDGDNVLIGMISEGRDKLIFMMKLRGGREHVALQNGYSC